MLKRNPAILCLLLSAMLFLSCISCTDTPPPAHHPIKVADYTILTENGHSYFVFDDIALYDKPNELASLEFTSIQEWINAVTQGTLSDHQKTVIATAFPRDDIGILCCDFNPLYTPKVPKNVTVAGLSWSGECYSFYLEQDSGAFAWLHYYSEEQYRDVFQSQYQNYFEKNTITVTQTESINNGQKTITHYTTAAGELMQVRYTLSNRHKTVVVDKTYRIQMNDPSLAASSSLPSNVTLYCEEDGVCYVVDLYDLDQDPADKSLLQFGMEPYTEN